MPKATDDVDPVLGIVRLGARVSVHEVVFQSSIDQDGELAGGGGDGLGFADAERHAYRAVRVRPPWKAQTASVRDLSCWGGTPMTTACHD